MPVFLNKCQKGDIVRPPKFVRAWLTFSNLNPGKCYRVVRVDRTHAYLQDKDMLPTYPKDLEMYQVKSDQEWMLPSDPIPEEGKIQLEKLEEVREAEKKSKLAVELNSAKPVTKKPKFRSDGIGTFQFELDDQLDESELPNQAKLCLAIIRENGKDKMTRKELEKLFNTDRVKARLGTKQEPFKIFWYYSRILEKLGFVNRW